MVPVAVELDVIKARAVKSKSYPPTRLKRLATCTSQGEAKELSGDVEEKAVHEGAECEGCVDGVKRTQAPQAVPAGESEIE